jgi:DNA-binding SARP family transcriptional activator
MMSTGSARTGAGSLEIRVLGEFAVLRNGENVGLPPSRKTRALLAYLAVVDRSQQRERLCRMFWDLPDDPRGALRWSLSKVRQIVNVDGGDALVTDRNTVALRSEPIALDLRQVQSLMAREPATIETSELEQAACLFQGGFLEDLSLPNCPEFEAWRTSQINDVDLLRARILRTLVARLDGDPTRALPYAHALLAMSPADEQLAAAIRLVWGFRCQGHITHFLSCCCFILLFDPRREHSSVPTAYYTRRRAQRRSRTALQRRRRLVLDHREHGGRMPVSGWFGTRDPREACHGPRAIAAEPRLYSVEPTYGPRP